MEAQFIWRRADFGIFHFEAIDLSGDIIEKSLGSFVNCLGTWGSHTSWEYCEKGSWITQVPTNWLAFLHNRMSSQSSHGSSGSYNRSRARLLKG